ncbi:MAG: PAS domain S-box protein [Acidobacteriota bacterium]
MEERSAQPATEQAPKSWPKGAALLLGGASVAVVLFLLFAHWQRLQTFALWQGRLTAMAQDREATVQRWLDDRQEDAVTLSCLLAAAPAGPGQEAEAAHLRELLAAMVRHDHYVGAALVGSGGEPLTWAGQRPSREALAFAREAAASGTAHRQRFLDEAGGPLVATVQAVRGPAGPASVLLLSDPARWLFPFLAKQPFPTESGECLLVEREKAGVRVLNPSRGGAAGRLVTQPAASWAASQAAAGVEAFGLMHDLDGTEVLAATQYLPGPGWGLVVQVDRWEAMAGYRRALAAGSFLLLAVFLIGGALLQAYVRHRRLLEMGRTLAERERTRAREALLARVLATQVQAQQAMVRAGSIEELRQTVCRLLVQEAGLKMAWIALKEPGTFRLAPAAAYGIALEDLKTIEVRWDDSPLGQGSMGTAVKTKRPSLHQDLLSEASFSPWRGFMERYGFRSVASFPIVVRGEVEGVLAVYSGERGAFFPELVELLSGLVSDLAFAEEALEDRLKRARAEAELEESRQTFQMLAESAHAAIFVYRGEEFVYVNPEVCRLTGYEAEELLGRSVLSVVHPEDLPLVRANLQLRGRGGSASPRYEFRVVAKGGQTRWIDFTAAAYAIRGEKAVLCTAYDITERKRAEERLAESERRYRAFFERNVAGIYRSRMGRGLTECNAAFARLFGYDSPEEVMAQPVEAFYLDEADRDSFRERILREGTVINLEARYRRKDGRTLWLLESAALVEDEAGGPPWIEGTCIDITERKELEEALVRVKNLETVGLIAGGVAHEVRNPLFAITTVVTALERKLKDHPEFGEYVSHIVDQTRRLNTLMNDLLALGRPVEEAAFAPVALQEVLRQCFELARKSLPGECPCTLDLPPEPLWVMGLSDKLVQVFLNLMQNAVSFTPPGGRVVVCARREEERAVVTVSDEGPGIAGELFPRLFQPFQTGRQGGTGLGLAIVRKIVQAHHGTVHAVNNDPPPGSTFTVVLPLRRGE